MHFNTNKSCHSKDKLMQHLGNSGDVESFPIFRKIHHSIIYCLAKMSNFQFSFNLASSTTKFIFLSYLKFFPASKLKLCAWNKHLLKLRFYFLVWKLILLQKLIWYVHLFLCSLTGTTNFNDIAQNGAGWYGSSSKLLMTSLGLVLFNIKDRIRGLHF